MSLLLKEQAQFFAPSSHVRVIDMGRFFRSLKTLKIAGAGAPTSAQLQEAGQTIFIEKSNQSDLGELILVQKANILQHQNQTLPHPGLSAIVEATIPDSGTPTAIKTPVDFEVLEVGLLAIKNSSAGAGAVTVAITDGTTSLLIWSGSVGAGVTQVIVNPLALPSATDQLSRPFLIDSTFYLMASSDAVVTAQLGYRTLSVR